MQPDSGVRTPGQQIGESGDVRGDMDQLSESALMYGSYAVSDSRGAGSGPGLASGFRGDAMSQVQDRASACACEAARWRSEGFFLGRFLIAAGASNPREISGGGALREPGPWLSDAPRAQHLPAPRPAPTGWDAHVRMRARWRAGNPLCRAHTRDEPRGGGRAGTCAPRECNRASPSRPTPRT